MVEIGLEDVLEDQSREVSFEAVVVCERCRGNGAEPGTPIETCPKCEGTGQLREVSQSIFGQVVRAMPCDRCGGDGRIPETPCEKCSGAGRIAETRTWEVDIPAGIEDGQRVRIAGAGHAGEPGARQGDLYVEIRVETDERFTRQGTELITSAEVPVTTAIVGGEVFVPTLEGELAVEVPAGTQHGETSVLSGRGLPPLRGGRRGNQHVVFELVVPTDLDDDQREAAERLAEALGQQDASAEMIRLAVRCAPEYAEPVMANLLELAPNGLEEERGPGWVEFAIYGPPGEVPDIGEIQAAAGGSLVDVTTTSVPDDWADRWTDFHRPIEVSGRIGVRPSWWDPKEGLIDVVVDPGRAFGTGGHPTTRLCLALLVTLEEAGEASGPIADWGTGSGVLGIAAAKLGWSPVTGLRPRARVARDSEGERGGQRG